MSFRANSGQGFCPFVRTGHAENLMSGGDQFLDGGNAYESGGTGDENTHEQVSKFYRRQISAQGLF